MAICTYCGREFYAWRSNQEHCSKECYGRHYAEQHPGFSTEYRRKKRILHKFKCRNCDTEYETTNIHRVFCGPSCKVAFHNSARTVTKFELRICPECNKTFRPMQKTGVGRKYCTPKCRNLAMNKKRHVVSKGVHWESQKRCKWNGNWYATLERDSFTCQLCGLKRIPGARTTDRRFILEVHHKDGSGETTGKNHQLSNLTTLCAACHREFHTKINLVQVDGKYFVRGKIFDILGLKNIDTCS